VADRSVKTENRRSGEAEKRGKKKIQETFLIINPFPIFSCRFFVAAGYSLRCIRLLQKTENRKQFSSKNPRGG
jgi:hypothetical protein